MRTNLFSLMWSLGLLAACQPALIDLKREVQSTSAVLNSEFEAVRKGQEAFVAEAVPLYQRRATLDLSTEGMDGPQGRYGIFAGNKYYFKKAPQGIALYFSPGRPVDDSMRQEVRFLEYLEPLLSKTAHSSPYLAIGFYGTTEPYTMALLTPPFDIVSVLPPAIDLNSFEWYQRGLRSSGSPVWSAKPFTDLATGWVMDVSVPLRVDGKTRGVGVSSLDLYRLASHYLSDKKQALVLMGPDTTVVGLSLVAESMLGMSGLHAMDYVKQTKENTFAPGRYRLNDSSQPPERQALARALEAAPDEFEFSSQGRSFHGYKQQLTENGMIVFGLLAP